MCGITGIVNYQNDDVVSDSILNKMCSVIKHRGPDEGGVWSHKNVGIGMRRLKIIDLVSGSQPMHNEDKTVWIVFNGEIYNYQELRAELEKKEHFFTTRSDTEKITHLYEEYAQECVQYLRGMFAFAIYDLNNEILFLARDRLDIKPLFYMESKTAFLFGSEIKCLFEYPNIDRSIYEPTLITYFAYGYVPDPDTMIEKVKKLPPGHMLIYKHGQVNIKKYWDITFNHNKVYSEDYYIERILHHLNDAVRLRLVSDVPLGAFLSGGIDSSMVVALMAKNMHEPVKTFSIGFEDHTYSELEFARILKEINCNIVQTFFQDATIFGVIAAKLAGRPKIIISRRDMGFWSTPLVSLIYRFITSMADAILTNSYAVKDQIKDKVFCKSVHVIPNGIVTGPNFEANISAKMWPANNIGFDEKLPVVVLVSNCNRFVKRVDLLIEAIPEIVKYKEAFFLVVGDGHLRPGLERRAKELRVDHCTKFVGQRRDVENILAGSDIAINTSDSEGSSNSIMEAVRAGSPVVASDVPGNRELVEDGHTGLLFCPGDTDSLAEKLLTVIQDKSLAKKMGSAGRQKIKRLFSIERMINEHMDFYISLLV